MASVHIGRYKVISELGRGGMGIVYRGEDPVLERQVAVKILPPKKLSAAMVERFLREARTAARLDSPYIIRIFDIGKEDEIHYIVMELLEGQTLGELIESEPLPGVAEMGRRLALFWQVLQAIRYAHEQKVVHRDLKPDNIMVLPQGTIKVMDFGLAFFADRHSLTQPGQIMGSAAYLSPEQAAGSDKIDQRTDIYSLGVILFELVTGRLPFEARHPMEMLKKVIEVPPPSPRDFNPAVPLSLEMMILRALRKKPEDRYQSAAEFAAELETLLARAPFRVSRLDPLAAPVPAADEPEPSAPGPPASEPPRRQALAPTAVEAPAAEEPPQPPGRQALPPTAVEAPLPRFADPIQMARLDARLKEAETGGSFEQEPPPPPSLPPRVPPARGFGVPLMPGPPVASSAWVQEAGRERLSGAIDQVLGRIRQDDEAQSRLMEEEAAQVRVLCSRCGAENVGARKLCSECGDVLAPSHFIVSREARAHLEAGIEHFRQGRWQEASFELLQALSRDEGLGEAHLFLGRAYLELGELERARESLERSAQLLPESPEPSIALAEYYQRTEQPDQVLACLHQALDREPGDADTRCRLAFLYHEQGRVDMAVEQYREVLRYQPAHLQANRQLGLILAASGRADEAIPYLEQACRLDPGDPHAHSLLARLYVRARRLDRAQQALRTAIQIDSQDASLHAELASLYQMQNRENLAYPELQKALEIDPGNREARLGLASIYERYNRTDEAISHLKEALDYHPRDVELHRHLGELYLRKGNLDGALEHFEEVVKLDPASADLHNRLGRIYLKKRYDQQSIAEYRKAVELHPVNPEYREDLAMAYYCAGQIPEAVAELSRASRLDGYNAAYAKGLGMLFFEMKDYPESVRQLKRSLELNPRDAQAHGMLGQSLARQGLHSLAIAEYEKALDLDPDLYLLHLYLARSYAALGRHNLAVDSFRKLLAHLGRKEETRLLSQAFVDMGRSYLASNDPARAAEVFQAALARNPRDTGALLGLARVAVRRKDFNRAHDLLARALECEPRSPEVLQAMAEAYGEQGRWEQAVKVLKRAVQEAPARADLHSQLGTALRKTGNLEEAAEVYRRAALAFPERAGHFQWKEGRILGRQGQWGEAAFLFRRALEREPHDYRIYRDLAQACDKLGEIGEAIASLQQAIDLAPEAERPALEQYKEMLEEELARQ